MKVGYADAIALARQKLNSMDPAEVCQHTGARWDGEEYRLLWLGEEKRLASGEPAEQVLWLHYLTARGSKVMQGKWIAYREVPGALFYEPKFVARAVRPIVKCYGSNPALLHKAGEMLGGERAKAGNAAITLPLLPYVPVTYIIWAGDEEMEAQGNILFDKTAAGWLPAEDLVVLASLGAYKLAGLYNAH